MMSYINETDFVIENKELAYPEIVTDGLQLYYDAKGKRDTDYHRDTMLDMSGNNNHGKLQNFAYEKHSGYKDGLVFDYIDDKLVRPELDLKPDDFTFMLNGNIISFSPDGTVKRVQDGEVIQSKGFNLLSQVEPKLHVAARDIASYNYEMINFHHDDNYPVKGDLVYIRSDIEVDDDVKGIGVYTRDFTSGHTGANSNVPVVPTRSQIDEIQVDGQDLGIAFRVQGTGTGKGSAIFSNMMAINLTKAFGKGNEPTLEQADEIYGKMGATPNPNVLMSTIEYRGNDLGDMENIIDGLYKTEVLSGEEIYTDKADDDAVVHVEVDGKSVGGGNNLFNAARYISENIYASSTYSAEEDGSLTIRGVDGTSQALYQTIVYLKPNTDYVMSFSDRMNERFEFVNASGNEISINRQWDGYTLKFTTNSTTDRMVGKFYPIKQEYPSNVLVKIEEGSVATEYELPSPTPDYPIEIHSLNDFDVVSSLDKRNIVMNGDRRISNSNYTVGNYSLSHLAQSLKVNDRVTYTVKGKLADDVTHISLYNSGGIGGRQISISKTEFDENGIAQVERTWKPGESTSLNIYAFPNSHTGIVTIDWIKVTIGGKDGVSKRFTPAPEDITEDDKHPLINKINLLLDEPLRSVGDVKDRLFRDSDGLWKAERNVGEGVFDGAENWYVSAGVFYHGNFSPQQKYGANGIIYASNILKPYKQASINDFIANADNNSFNMNTNSAYIRIKTDKASTVEEIKSFLNTNNLKVIYQLATPTLETLDQKLQDKLNNLRSFSEINYVYTIDGNTNLLDTVPLLNNYWYPSLGVLENPAYSSGQTATKDAISVYPGANIHLTKITTTTDKFWRIVWVDKDNNFILRKTSTDNDLVLTTPSGAYGMRVSYPNGSNAVIKFHKPDISSPLSKNLKPTLHAKFLYNNWYKEDRVINNLMIYNRALTNEEMSQNYKTIKRRWGM